MVLTERAYGWRHSKPDQRDFQYHAMLMRARALPALVDLRGIDNPIYDQGQLGSCVGNGCGDAWEFALRAEGLPAPLPSRLFIYYFGRELEGTVLSDSGLEIRDGLKVLATKGCCDEKLWRYDIAKFKSKPSKSAIAAAVAHKATNYYAVQQNITVMKTCLADGFPIVIGMTVYESFESQAVADGGVVPMPGRHEQAMGGHCVVIVGYDDKKRLFIVRNSWGEGWGDRGYCYIPYEYLTSPKLASDFWTVRAVS